MKINIYILLVIGSFVITSCFDKEQKLILPPTAGDQELGIAEMTGTYKYQVYYDLSTNSTVSLNTFTEWDLGFSSSDTAWNIVLNNSKTMLAGNTNSIDFEGITSHDGYELDFDRASGDQDSLAITAWNTGSIENPVSNNYVFIVDRGYDENYDHAGYKKIVFLTPEDNKFIIQYADLDGQNEEILMIEKDTSVNYVCFSFDTGIVNIEPEKTDWTVRFTYFRTLYPDNDGVLYPYNVAGALLNPHNTEAQIDTTAEFTDIDLSYAQNIELTKDLDIIGFAWKFYNFDEGYYSIVDGWNYIIKDHDNYYYKLRFVDFYNDSGEKGYPTFEFARL